MYDSVAPRRMILEISFVCSRVRPVSSAVLIGMVAELVVEAGGKDA